MTSLRVLSVTAAFALLAGCGGNGADDFADDDAPPAATAAAGTDHCALLTDAEVTEAIGPHGGGRTGEGEWGNMGCRWTATTVQDVSGFPDGWRDAVEVAVFDENRTAWARDQATGSPVPGFVDGALFDESYGDLWFPCAAGRMCVVKARTASGDRRQEIALRLARLVNGRV
jgi:hypothetical protein